MKIKVLSIVVAFSIICGINIAMLFNIVAPFFVLWSWIRFAKWFRMWITSSVFVLAWNSRFRIFAMIVVLANLLERCGSCKLISHIIKLLCSIKMLIWTVALDMFSSTDSAIELFFLWFAHIVVYNFSCVFIFVWLI
jgi:hypothetical protein